MDLLPNTDYTYSVTNTWKEKLELMKIDGSLSISLMFGAIKVGGSGSYLDSMRSKTNMSSMTSRMYIQTEQHSILMRNEEVADLIGNAHCYGSKDFDS